SSAPPASWGRIASVASLAALVTALSLHVWFPHLDSGPVNDSYNVDVGGRNAFYQFTERHMPFTRRNHESLVILLDTLGSDNTLCLLGPARYPSEREWTALLAWVSVGGKLLLAARWDDASLVIPGIPAQVIGSERKTLAEKLGVEKPKSAENPPTGQ